MGRSFGCPAFRPQDTEAILGTIYQNALLYSYVGDRCLEDQNIIDQTVPDWELMCSTSPITVAPVGARQLQELAPASSPIPQPRPDIDSQAPVSARTIGAPARTYRSEERADLARQIIDLGPDAFATTRVQIGGSCFEVMNDSPTLPDGTYVPFTFQEAERMAQRWGWQIPNLAQAQAIRQFAEREGIVFPAITRSNDTVAQREASIGDLLNDINARRSDRRVGDMRARAQQGQERLVNGHFKWYIRHNNQYQIYGFSRAEPNGYYQLNPSSFHSSQADYVDYSHGVRLLRPCPN
jgi:hypothetical protein